MLEFVDGVVWFFCVGVVVLKTVWLRDEIALHHRAPSLSPCILQIPVHRD